MEKKVALTLNQSDLRRRHQVRPGKKAKKRVEQKVREQRANLRLQLLKREQRNRRKRRK
jgi:hypothetical protein